MKTWRGLWLALSVSVLALLGSRTARADEVAPSLEPMDLRVRAETELRRLVANLSPEEQRRLVGIYVASDPTMTDLNAQIACDDDGDFVVVITDAMLRLVSYLARIESVGGEDVDARVDHYAAFLARSQIAGARLLPPPAGSFDHSASPGTEASYEARLHETLSFVLAAELARARARDITCPHPTMTRERGDAVWTASEAKGALAVAARIYPGRVGDWDTEALARTMALGHTEAGPITLTRWFATFEARSSASTVSSAKRFWPSYTRLHPTATRANLADVARTIRAATAAPTSGTRL